MLEISSSIMTSSPLRHAIFSTLIGESIEQSDPSRRDYDISAIVAIPTVLATSYLCGNNPYLITASIVSTIALEFVPALVSLPTNLLAKGIIKGACKLVTCFWPRKKETARVEVVQAKPEELLQTIAKMQAEIKDLRSSLEKLKSSVALNDNSIATHARSIEALLTATTTNSDKIADLQKQVPQRKSKRLQPR